MPGTVALPHGWGHQNASGLPTAAQTRGVNTNLLFPDGPDSLEPLSGLARLTAVEVQVSPCAEVYAAAQRAGSSEAIS